MRVTQGTLNATVNKINEMTNSPTEYRADGVIQIGHYTLSGAYGGWQLQRVMNTGGGVDLPLGETGHVPKKELYGLMQSFIRGLEVPA